MNIASGSGVWPAVDEVPGLNTRSCCFTSSSSLARTQHRRWRAALARMPIAVTIETAYGAVGLVHADVPDPDWAVATAMLEAGAPDHVDIALLGPDASEDEVRRHRSRPVAGLRALVHGHFVVDAVERVANRWNIDTGATLRAGTGSRCFTSTRGAFARGRSTLTRGADAWSSGPTRVVRALALSTSG